MGIQTKIKFFDLNAKLVKNIEIQMALVVYQLACEYRMTWYFGMNFREYSMSQ